LAYRVARILSARKGNETNCARQTRL
jgi:hypothetical protein